MCIAPNTLADGTQVVCRECWQCLRSKVDDIVGRGIAEMRTAKAAHVVTLTYGRDQQEGSTTYGEAEHERAVLLTYSDVQKLLKLLRFNGYPCRYLAVGEYGSTKGRAHWHVVFFWTDKVPRLDMGGPGYARWARYDPRTGEQAKGRHGEPAEFWPHGHVYAEPATYESLRYVLKYVLKEVGQGADEQQYLKNQSKEPPLGAVYFAGLAERYAENGLAPRDGFYDFPEAQRRDGSRVQFMLHGASERRFIEAYVDAWGYRHGAVEQPFAMHVVDWRRNNGTFRHMPRSEWLDEKLEKMYAGVLPLSLQPYAPKLEAPDHLIRARLRDMIGEPIPETLDFDEVLNSWFHEARDGRRWYWRLQEGKWKWQNPDLERSTRRHEAEFRERVAYAKSRGKPWDLQPAPPSRPALPVALRSSKRR